MRKRSIASIDQRVKHWNQLTATRASFQVDSIKIIESTVFAAQTIHLDRIIAFVGMHGTGKSLMLRTIEAAFGYTTPVYTPPFLPRGGQVTRSAAPSLKGVIEVSLSTPSGQVRRTVDLSDPAEARAQLWREILGESFNVWYADPIAAFSELDYMRDNYDFTSEREASESERQLNRADLDASRNILGRQYDSVTIRSVHVDDEIDLPFVSARLDSKLFDNTIMSQGELWVHYINWFLEYDADKGNLALIDEPESFLSAQGRRPLIDHIAWLALRHDRQVIVGTHSPEILSRFPLANVRVCVPDDSGIRIITPRSIIEIHDSVGMQTSIRGLALVEDELAKQVLSTIFARYDTALTREVEIIPTGGASEVVNGSLILERTDRFICFAIFDGDQRLTGGNARSPVRTPYFLPGVDCPENELTNSALEQINWLSEVIGVHADQIVAAINSCRYLDHQYRIGRIAEQLGYREETLTPTLIHAWLRQPEIAQEAERLAIDVRSRLSMI